MFICYKVSTVHNEEGPQLTCDTAVSDVKRESQHHYNTEGANMELRLDAIESHCNVQGKKSQSYALTMVFFKL